MAKKLSKGLGSIFGEDIDSVLDEISKGESDIKGDKVGLKISEIRPNPYQPRKIFDEDALKDLSASIKERGVFQPILVRKSKTVKGYELIAGKNKDGEGTTVSFNKFIYNGYTFIDTPGLIDDDSFLTNVDNKMIKKLLPLKTIKPSVFQVYSKQAYLIEGLVEILVSPKKEASITFLINNNLDIHRTKLENSDSYLNKNIDKMSLKLWPFKDNYYDACQRLFYLRGLGLIIVKGKCRINIRVNKKIKIYEKKVVI